MYILPRRRLSPTGRNHGRPRCGRSAGVEGRDGGVTELVTREDGNKETGHYIKTR